ncbi:MAG: mechanosensitive ion channel, partial [Anaerolineales bacterium]|nr:mechanosensitive ion channel [Anaerolineales bacterium]
MLETVVAWLRLHAGLETELQWRLVLSAAALAALLLLRALLMHLLRWRKNGDDLRHYRWRKAIEITVFLLGGLLMVRLWLTATAGAATYLGLITAGLTIALQDPLTNLVGWMFLVWRRPFTVGDRVQVGQQAGDVIDIRFFQFTLMEIREWVDADQSTGRILHLPNRRVFSESIANFTRGFAYIWNELAVEVTFES